jgi:hypothetical protein
MQGRGRDPPLHSPYPIPSPNHGSKIFLTYCFSCCFPFFPQLKQPVQPKME